jgi:radical SAM superfamily enzyme YgiQ (UPF0313 family)
MNTMSNKIIAKVGALRYELNEEDAQEHETLIQAELSRLFPRRLIKKVMFVVPPDGDKTLFDYATAKRGRYWNYPAYGVGVISSFLRRDGVEVEIVNLNNEVLKICHSSVSEESFEFDQVWQNYLEKRIEQFRPDMIGVTCMFTQSHKAVVDVCGYIKRLLPDVPLAGGGVHITNSFVNWQQSQSILEDLSNVDLLFLYETEIAFQTFIRAVNKSVQAAEIFQTYFNTSEHNIWLTKRKFPDGDALNVLPAFDLMDVSDASQYGTIGSFTCLLDETVAATALANRGCRAHCTFCSVRSFNGKGVREKSVQTVIDELLVLKNDFGVNHVMWLDDDFLYNRHGTMELFDEMVRQNVDITWDCTNGVIAASCTEDIIAAAAKSGCIGVNIGMESGNEEILRSVKKPGNVRHFLKAAENFKKYPQINTRVFLMIGFPNETYSMILDTFTIAKEMDLDWYNITTLQPLPNTPIFDSMVQLGLIEDIKAEDVRYNSGGYGKKREKMRREQHTEMLNPFEGVDLDSIPEKEDLERIWMYMNFHLNFSRILELENPIKLNQQLRYLTYITEKVAPDDPFPMYFCGYLQKKINGHTDVGLIDRLESRLAQSSFWRNSFSSYSLKPAALR